MSNSSRVWKTISKLMDMKIKLTKVSISVMINVIMVRFNIFVDRAVFTITICSYTAIQGGPKTVDI